MVASTPSPFVVTSLLGIFAILVGIALLGAPGLLLLVLGLRGKRIDKHPRCRGCGYDLSGHDGTPKTCPECGRELAAKRAVRIGNRKRRPMMTTLGALMVAISLCSIGTIMWARTSQIKLIEHYPVWLLQMEMESDVARTVDAAMAELQRRHQSGELDPRHVDDVLTDLLKTHADAAAYWSDEHSRFIEMAWRDGVLGDDRMAAYVRTAIDLSLSFEARPQVRAGSQMPIRLVTGNKRLSSEFGQSFMRNPRNESFVLQSGLIEIRDGERIVGGAGRTYSTSTVNPGYSATGRTWEVDLGPGTFDLAVAAELKLLLVNEDSGIEQPGREITTWRVEGTVPIDILPSDQQLIKIIPDDDARLESEIRQAVLIDLINEKVRIHESHTTSFEAGRGFVSVHRPPVDVAFSVFGREDDTETLLGTVATKANEPASGGWLNRRIRDLYPEAVSVDIILRADPEVAERTMDINEIWGGELVFEHVPLGPVDDDQRDDPPG